MKQSPICIIVSSTVEAKGLEVIISKIPGIKSHPVFRFTEQDVLRLLASETPALVIADPFDLSLTAIDKIKTIAPTVKIIGWTPFGIPSHYEKNFDATIGRFSSEQSVLNIISQSLENTERNENATSLTSREKEILIRVVKGLTNKEIAAEINVSVNTVMTHRRNIASKLKIHSPAGLTIYALVSKLVSLDQINPHD